MYHDAPAAPAPVNTGVETIPAHGREGKLPFSLTIQHGPKTIGNNGLHKGFDRFGAQRAVFSLSLGLGPGVGFRACQGMQLPFDADTGNRADGEVQCQRSPTPGFLDPRKKTRVHRYPSSPMVMRMTSSVVVVPSLHFSHPSMRSDRIPSRAAWRLSREPDSDRITIWRNRGVITKTS